MTTFAEAEIHVGDIGTRFELTLEDGAGTAVNISSATVKRIDFRKPSGTVIQRTASFVTTGADGKLYYVSILGDLDEVGRWYAQPYIEMTGFKGHPAKVPFVVYDVLT